MNRPYLLPVAALSLIALAAPALAQKPSTPGSVAGEGTFAVKAPAEAQENVEILRRLLGAAFAETYGYPGRQAGSIHVGVGPYGIGPYEVKTNKNIAGNEAHAAPHIEGVYLKDYGVVYTTTLPPPAGDPLPGSGATPSSHPALDPWERTRKEIRGDAPEPEGKPVAGHQPLSEVILKVLAENGRHFTSLGEGERITVAVTFRGAAVCASCHANPWKPMGQVLSDYDLDGRVDATKNIAPEPPNHNPPGTPPDTGSPPLPPQGSPAWMTDVRNDTLLGDLHLKQGKAKEAIEAYKKALDSLGKTVDPKRFTDTGYIASDLPLMMAGVELMNKMAQAMLAAGDEDGARRTLGSASDLAKKAEVLTGPIAATNAKSGLPAKLVVSAPKKLLEEVGGGKMTFEAFCKAATVEYTAAPAEKK